MFQYQKQSYWSVNNLEIHRSIGRLHAWMIELLAKKVDVKWSRLSLDANEQPLYLLTYVTI